VSRYCCNDLVMLLYV
jgi:hypothetical protein